MARRSDATRREARREDAATIVGDHLAEQLFDLEGDEEHLRTAEDDGLIYRTEDGGLSISHDDGETFVELVAIAEEGDGEEVKVRFAGSPRNKYGTHASKGFTGNYATAWRCHFSAIGGGALTGKATGPIRGTVRRTEMIAANMKPKCSLPSSENMGARAGAKSPLVCDFPEKPSDYDLERWAKPSDDELTAEDVRLTCKDLNVIKRAAIAEIKRRAADREKAEATAPEDAIDLEELRSIEAEFADGGAETAAASDPPVVPDLDPEGRQAAPVAPDVGFRRVFAERYGAEPDDSVIDAMNASAISQAAYTAGYAMLDIVMANVTAEADELGLEDRLQNTQNALNEFGAIIADLMSHAVSLGRSAEHEDADGADVNPGGEDPESVNPPPGESDAAAQDAILASLDSIRSMVEEGGDAARAQVLLEELADNLERIIPEPPPDETAHIATVVSEVMGPVLERLEDLERSLGERPAPVETVADHRPRPMYPPPRRSHAPRLAPAVSSSGRKGVPLSELVRRRTRSEDFRQ